MHPRCEVNAEVPKEASDSHVQQMVGVLTEQPWYELGNGSDPYGATSDRKTMVKQLTSVLHYRLADMIRNSDDYPHETRVDMMAATKVDEASHLSKALCDCLMRYTERIVSMYEAVFFHSIEHATHVTISMNKLVSMLPGHEDFAPNGTEELSSALSLFSTESAGRANSDRSRRSSLGHISCRQPQARTVNVQRPRFPDSTYQSDSIPSSLGSRSYARNSGRSVGMEHPEDSSIGLSELGQSLRHANRGGSVDLATFGIGADPMLRFALVFAAVVHDVGHQGVPNDTLVEEEDPLAICHNDVSVAEQNSLQVAFTLLNSPEFAVLKRAIMPTRDYRKRFRALVIDLVLTTDISNPERMQINQAKWREAFLFDLPTDVNNNGPKEYDLTEVESTTTSEDITLERRRRHTMNSGPLHARERTTRIGLRQSLQLSGKIIDTYEPTSEGQYLMQQHALMGLMMNVADVAHTIQSFDTFVKWNRRLYKEMLYAYHNDRAPDDPTIGWYQNQINFFDCYIIPKLTTRLDQCGSFGHRAAMFSYFALENRRRWVEEGQLITDEMVQSVARELLAHHQQDEDDDDRL